MSNKTSDEIKNQIKRLRGEGLTIKEIAKITNVGYSFTFAICNGFESYLEYRNHVARLKGFTSHQDYNCDLIKKKGFKSNQEYKEYLAKKNGFDSYSDYRNSLAQKKGFESHLDYEKNRIKSKGFSSFIEYYNHMAQRMGFESYKEYLEHQAKQRGFNSMRDYREYMDEQKQKRAETQVLSSLIKERLTELGENQSWLAKKLNVSRQMVSLYIQGKRMPSKKRLHDLFLILDVPYQSLDDLLQ